MEKESEKSTETRKTVMITKITIHLSGKLKEICDGMDQITLGAASPRMAVTALQSRFGPEVRKYIIPRQWQLYKGTDEESGSITELQIDDKFEEDTELFIYEYIEGASGRLGRAILGTVLIVSGVLLSPTMPNIGAALVSTGVGMVLQSFFTPDIANLRERPEERASFLFSGATNTSQQGQPVPLVFGRFRTGSVVVSAGLDVEQLQTYDTEPYPGAGGGGGGSVLPPNAPIWWPDIIQN